MINGLAVVGFLTILFFWILLGVTIFEKQEEAKRKQERERFDELSRPIKEQLNLLTIEVSKLSNLRSLHDR